MVGARLVTLWGGPCDGTNMHLDWGQKTVFVATTPNLGPGQRSPRTRYWYNEITERFEWDRTFIDKDYYA